MPLEGIVFKVTLGLHELVFKGVFDFNFNFPNEQTSTKTKQWPAFHSSRKPKMVPRFLPKPFLPIS